VNYILYGREEMILMKGKTLTIVALLMFLTILWLGSCYYADYKPESIKQVQLPKIPDVMKVVEKVNEVQYKEVFVRVEVDELNVRDQPTIYSNIERSVYIGDVLRVKGIATVADETWFILNDDTYVHSKYVRRSEEGLSSRGRENFTLKVNALSNMSKLDIDNITKNTSFNDIPNSILYLEKKYYINAFFMIAVAKLESANGYSHLAKDRNNLFGYNAYGDVDKNAKHYNSSNESFKDFAQLIRNNYINKGLLDIYDIGSVYCESSDWAGKVQDIMLYDLNYLRNLK
jgi:beta-N-acetylglucosaminidase